MSHNISSNVFDFLNKTNELLLEMPLYKKMKSHNDELKEKVKALKYTIEYLELINANLTKKNKKLKMKLKNKTCHVSQQFNGDIFEDVNEDIFEDVNEDFNEDVNENVNENVNEDVIEDFNEDPNIKMEIVELEKTINYNEDAVVEDAKEEVDAQEEEVDAQEEEVDAQEEEDDEVEEVVEAQVEAEVEEEEEVDVQEDEEEAEEEAEEEEADVYEVTIKGKTYYVSNEVDSIIYAADENGDISIEAGIYKNGKPVFNKTK